VQIKELNTEQFRDLIRETVAEVLDDYIDHNKQTLFLPPKPCDK
jgi:hypothetical protein